MNYYTVDWFEPAILHVNVDFTMRFRYLKPLSTKKENEGFVTEDGYEGMVVVLLL